MTFCFSFSSLLQDSDDLGSSSGMKYLEMHSLDKEEDEEKRLESDRQAAAAGQE